MEPLCTIPHARWLGIGGTVEFPLVPVKSSPVSCEKHIMLKFVLVRAAHTIPVLIGVTFVVFVSLYLAPGDVTQHLLGMFASEERAAELRTELGLDKPVIVQYAVWLWNLLQGDLGTSPVMKAPVLEIIANRVVNSLILMAGSMVIVIVVSFVLGTFSAAHFRGTFDRFTVFLSLLFAGMPVFWLGLVLLYLFSVHWNILPSAGMYDIGNPGGFRDLLHHLILPAVTTAIPSIAIMTRMTRSAMVDVLAEPYIVSARARGLPRRRVIFVHAVRNVLPQYVNMAGLNVGFLFGGAVFSEIIFTWPGIGLQLYDSILKRDGLVVQGCVLAIAVVFVAANFLADLISHSMDTKSR